MTFAEKLGAVPSDGTKAVSSSRTIMFAAFAFFAACAVFVAAMIGLGNPAVHVAADGTMTNTWSHYIGFMGEVGDTIRWFIGPYVVQRGAQAIEKRKEA